MRTTTDHGVSYSIVPFGAVRLLFLSATPKERTQHPPTAADYETQFHTLLRKTSAFLQAEGFQEGVLIMNVFLANIGMKQLLRKIVDEVEDELNLEFPLSPLTTYIPQPPAAGHAVALELLAVVGDKPKDIRTDRHEYLCRMAEWQGVRWGFGSDFVVMEKFSGVGAYELSGATFSQMKNSLEWCKFPVDSLVRTWIYQGHLVFPEGGTQRYKELNRARTDFFGDTEFLKQYVPPEYKGKVYPASTGIGADDFDVVMSCCALSTERKDVIVVPLENPRQTSAFDYGEEYSPQSPKFARAMAVAFDDSCLIFVSGTAAITDSESRCIDDPEGQTNITLDNIAALIDSENLERHGVRGYSCGLQNLESVRVYVKRPAEVERIKAVCEQRLGDVPILYTIADVCRDELLVEIEGIAVCSK